MVPRRRRRRRRRWRSRTTRHARWRRPSAASSPQPHTAGRERTNSQAQRYRAHAHAQAARQRTLARGRCMRTAARPAAGRGRSHLAHLRVGDRRRRSRNCAARSGAGRTLVGCRPSQWIGVRCPRSVDGAFHLLRLDSHFDDPTWPGFGDGDKGSEGKSPRHVLVLVLGRRILTFFLLLLLLLLLLHSPFTSSSSHRSGGQNSERPVLDQTAPTRTGRRVVSLCVLRRCPVLGCTYVKRTSIFFGAAGRQAIRP